MKTMVRGFALTIAVAVMGCSLAAQTAGTSSAASPQTNTQGVASQVPRLVKFSGTLQNLNGSVSSEVAARESAAATSVVGMTFSLYSEQTGSAPLWTEVQNVQVDSAGHYTVELGSTTPEGLPAELFSNAQAQWLGVRQEGQAEQPRIMLMSVPYALKAADAETFGGKPPSAYMPAANPSGTAGSSGTTIPAANGSAKNNPPAIGGSGTANYIAMWSSSSNLTSSAIYESSSHNVGIGTTSPDFPLVVHAHSSHEVLQVTQGGAGGSAILGYAYATSGDNNAIEGQSASTSGTGIFGYATSATGSTFGVTGASESNEGIGVYGIDSSGTGATLGVLGISQSSGGIGVKGSNSSATGETYGVLGDADSSSGIGVGGTANSTTGFAIGVYGTTNSTTGSGVVGFAAADTGAAFGVKGVSDSVGGIGVYAVSNTDSGSTYGLNATNGSPDGVAAYGENTSTTGDAVAVWGATDSTEGIGVYGVGIDTSETSVGERPIGVWGNTNQGGGIAVAGTADSAIAIAGSNNAPSIATADFINEESTRIDSPVLVTRGSHYDGLCLIDVSGNLDCTGSKSAVVPVDEGTRKVALYAVEAPENWFEDFGSGQLAGGSAVVALESTFAQTVNSGVAYHVFLTPKGDCKGLYVTNETAGSFEVRELAGGASNVAFDYRIVARRKGYESIRLADNTERFAAAAAERKVPSADLQGSTKAKATSPARRKLVSSATNPKN